MMKIPLSDFRQRFDPDLCKGIVEMCIQKKCFLMIIHGEEFYYSSILQAQLKGETPYLIIDSLIPTDNDKLAKGRTEVSVKLSYIHKGVVYHLRFHLILYGVTQHEGIKAILSTPPLDLQIASEGFTSRPSIENPLWVKIPLFKEEIRADVKLVSVKGVVFEDRLIVDTLPTLSKYERIHLDFGDSEISVPGRYSSSGEKKVEFHFGKLPEKEQEIIYEYLEKLWHEQGHKKDSGKGLKAKDGTGEKKVKFPVPFLCEDNDYFVKMSQALDKDNYSLVRFNDLKECNVKIFEYPWKIILVDNKFKDIDLWEFTRHLQKLAEENGKNLPVLILLSDDMSEEKIMYAQYAGFKHIYPRDSFRAECTQYLNTFLGKKTSSPADKPIILVIDDDRNITFPLEHALTSEGYMPIIATSGSEGVRYAKAHQLSLIILEPAIRSKDGINAARILKRMPFTKDVPLLILSVINNRVDIDAIKQLGINGFIKKPAEPHVIIERIKNICCNTSNK